jgi:hypothetical protein
MSHEEQIKRWAQEQPWLHIGVVVVVGWLPEAFEIIRRCKPMCDIIVYDPLDEGAGIDEHEGEEGYWRVQLKDSIRNKLGHRRFPHWQVAMLAPPEMQGAGRFTGIAPAIENLVKEYSSELSKPDARDLAAAAGGIKSIVDDLLEAHPAHVQEIEPYVIGGEQFARCKHLTLFANVKKWTEIGLELLPEYVGKTPIQELAGACKGRHGLIVGAGPSLNQAMFWLPAVQDRIVICATEAALPVLERGGVKPDIIVAVEAQEGAYDGISELELWQDAILVPGIHASPRVWGMPAKHICPGPTCVGPVGYWLFSNTELESLDTGGSVSTVGYSILDRLGCDTIAGVGIDSAYGPKSNMRAYASGVRGGSGKQKQPVAHEELPAWGGEGTVASSPQLKAYRDWFGVQARTKERQHINLSVGGARIEGWHEMELPDWKALVEELEPVPPIAVPYKPLDLSWTISALEEQLEGATYAAEVTTESIRIIDRFHETMTKLGKLHELPNARLVSTMQISPLETMALLPGPVEMNTLKKMNQSFLETINAFVPLFERCLERMRKTHARAA